MRAAGGGAAIVALVGLCSTAAPAQAQALLAAYYVAGVGEAGSSRDGDLLLHAAAGLDVRVANRWLGLGGEIGYLTVADDLLGGIGVLSANAALRFGPAAALVPFATAGYSLLFPSPTYNAFHVGAGVEWSPGRSVALRVELRNYLPQRFQRLWVARAGLTFG